MTKFKLDENLPVEAARLLCDAGYDALTVSDQNMAGESDAHIAEACRKEGRTMVTLDMHFADIRAYPPSAYAGIIVLRLTRLDKPHVLSYVQRLLPVLGQELPAGNLWIVEDTGIRVRG